jgi:hypothetical protein
MIRSSAIAAAALLSALLPGCVTEEVRPDGVQAPRIFGFEPASLYLAGAYHGVNLFFELDPGDAPDASQWMMNEGDRQLPPIVPEIAPGGREIYRVRDIHRVDYANSMFVIGEHSYLRMPQARLYLFKERDGNFKFTFRGQPIVVPSTTQWSPSVYYYAVEDQDESGRFVLIEEVVSVGFARIESYPREGKWLVNGRPYYPEGARGALELEGAVHVAGSR